MTEDVPTDRLRLIRLDTADEAVVEAVFSIQSDPATWRHLPEGVETDRASNRMMIAEYERSWREEGAGWWALALREPLAGVPTGTIVGLGGVARRDPTIAAWNLGYRLTPAVWGHGLAAEVSRAAIVAAAQASAVLPVTARALARNQASWRVLERIGLTLAWEGPVPELTPLTAGLALRIYGDRPLDAGLIAQIAALG